MREKRVAAASLLPPPIPAATGMFLVTLTKIPPVDTASLKKCPGRSPYEIVFINGNWQTLPDKLELLGNHLKLQHIADIDRDHKGHEFMVPIRPPPRHFQPNIQFGRSLDCIRSGSHYEKTPKTGDQHSVTSNQQTIQENQEVRRILAVY